MYEVGVEPATAALASDADVEIAGDVRACSIDIANPIAFTNSRFR